MGNITSKNNSKAVAKVINTLHARFDLDPDPKVTKKNLSVSTISIGVILGITLAGAEGNTAQEIMDSLEVTRDEVDDLLNSFRAALRDLKKVKVKVANKVVVKEDYEVKKTYIKTVKRAFRAEIDSANFREPAKVTKRVNDWVKATTNGKVRGIVSKEDFNDLTRILVLNAVYLKAKFQKPFESTSTSKYPPFYVTRDESVTVSMMNQTDYFMGASTDDLDLIRMDYKGSKDFHFYLGLPKSRRRFAQGAKTWRNLDFDSLDLVNEEYRVGLPKFKVESRLNGLVDSLKAMGIEEMFDREMADLSGMTTDPNGLYITDIVQKSYIEVDEKGTEAAAVTISYCDPKSARKRKRPKEFFADRPFYYAIVKSGLIIFSGHVMDPSKH